MREYPTEEELERIRQMTRPARRCRACMDPVLQSCYPVATLESSPPARRAGGAAGDLRWRRSILRGRRCAMPAILDGVAGFTIARRRPLNL